jgi:hypothetical protein
MSIVAGTNFATFGATSSSSSIDVLGDGTSGIYIWGAQLNLGSTAMSYQRIAAAPTLSQPPTYATTSTMGGEVFRPYLSFDGSDDSLVSNSVNFSSYNSMSVCAGVYKETTNASVVIELTGYNNGSWTLLSGANLSRAGLKGANGNLTYGNIGAAKAAPSIDIPHVVFDLNGSTAATEIVARVNGASQTYTSEAFTDSTGPFGTYTMTMGLRGNEAKFTGRIYGIIVRSGSNSTADAQVCETWVASKAGVTL